MHHFRYDPFADLKRDGCTVGALRASVAGHDVSIRARGRRFGASPTSAADLALAKRPA
jgi:hypothetical protein